MIYGKLVDGELRGAPNPLKTEESYIFTNNAAIYLANGYKPIILTDSPSDGKSYLSSWTETETEIIQVWTEVQQSDNDSISDSEALTIITGGTDI